jgi:Zn-dependent protease
MPGHPSVMERGTLYELAVWVVPLIIAIVLHEVAHGLVARKLGDPTAGEKGRLSLNPLRHIDFFGTLILPLILTFSHAPVFGWAKPVPVDYGRLRKPRRDMVLVALAGPAMNLFLALTGSALLAITILVAGNASTGAAAFVADNALNFVFINIFLAVFNLLPVPPFDGGHVLEGLLPQRLRPTFQSIGRYSLLVLMALLLVLPAISSRADVVDRVVSPIVAQIARLFLALFGLRL